MTGSLVCMANRFAKIFGKMAEADGEELCAYLSKLGAYKRGCLI